MLFIILSGNKENNLNWIYCVRLFFFSIFNWKAHSSVTIMTSWLHCEQHNIYLLYEGKWNYLEIFCYQGGSSVLENSGGGIVQ